MATYWENSCSFGLRNFSWYKYLIVSLVFFRLGFWSGNLFLIAPFPDRCLLVPFHICEIGRFRSTAAAISVVNVKCLIDIDDVNVLFIKILPTQQRSTKDNGINK